MYKILTSILSEYTYSFFIYNGLFPDEQKGCKRRSYGYKNQLLITLFCVTLIPLSKLLNNTGYGYKIYDNTINHFFYMDYLKLFSKNDQQLQGLLNIVKQFSDYIQM